LVGCNEEGKLIRLCRDSRRRVGRRTLTAMGHWGANLGRSRAAWIILKMMSNW